MHKLKTRSLDAGEKLKSRSETVYSKKGRRSLSLRVHGDIFQIEAKKLLGLSETEICAFFHQVVSILSERKTLAFVVSDLLTVGLSKNGYNAPINAKTVFEILDTQLQLVARENNLKVESGILASENGNFDFTCHLFYPEFKYSRRPVRRRRFVARHRCL